MGLAGKTSIVLVLGLGVCVGCHPNALPMGDPNAAVAQSQRVDVSVQVPKRVFNVGETFDVTVKIHNKSSDAVKMAATSGAPVYLHLVRFTSGPFEEHFKTYPQSAIMAMSPWVIRPGEVRTFTLTLKVEPDWPRGEAMKLFAEVNGYKAAQPSLLISVAQ